MEVDLYVLPMQGFDAMLGIQWLQNLGKVTLDYAKQTMEFTLLDITYSLKGDESLHMKKILRQMQALLDQDEVYGVYDIHSLAMAVEVEETQPKDVALENAELTQLLKRFDSLFQIPTTLPPYHLIDHRIHLLPDTKRVNVRPYRYPHYQKVKKKDDGYIFCVDYRALNTVTIQDKFPIPTADEMFDELEERTTLAAHLEHLECVSKCLQQHQFYVKRSMCVFGAETLEYFGHIISGDIKVVREWTEPTTQCQVRWFLRLAGYYRHFIKGYATMTEALIDLLRKDNFKWGVQEAPAFEELKQQLSTTPVLSLPDFNHVFVMEADASANGIGALLLQNSRPISYFGRKMGPRMRITTTYQKELLQLWKRFINGIPIQQKYVRKLTGFDFEVEYKPGASNQVADALSRMYEDKETVRTVFMALNQCGFRREHGLIIFQDRYCVGKQSKLKRLLLQEFHNTPSAGHGGVKKMLVGLSALFYWLGIRKSVEEYIKQCLVCQQTKDSTQAMGGYRQPLPTTTAIWEDVSMDFITGLPVSKGLMVILMVVDRFSKYTHFKSLPTSFNAHKVVELFLEIVIKHHGIPKVNWSSKVVDVDELLVERDGLMQQIKQNLLEAINRMEVKVNRNRRDVEFNVGDKILKLFTGTEAEIVTKLPEEFQEGQPLEQPVAICDS
nr:hypothetical protein [Tanacetum cinerariifolium]